jgi:hypothetical protein
MAAGIARRPQSLKNQWLANRETVFRPVIEVGKSAPDQTDCVAGQVGLELRNVVANHPIVSSFRFPGIRPNPVAENIRG